MGFYEVVGWVLDEDVSYILWVVFYKEMLVRVFNIGGEGS